MDLLQLRYFYTLAKMEHMTRAAAALHVAQPALSRSLRNLETELGVTLFDRVGKGLKLNSNGAILLEHCTVALRELDTARQTLTALRDRNSRQVSLAVLAGSKLLPDIVRGFNALYPDITLQIIQQLQPGDGLEQSDIVIDTTVTPAEGEHVINLMEEEIMLALPRNNPLSGRTSIHLAEAADQPFICLYKGRSLRTITDGFCQQAGFAPQIVLECDNPGTVRELIALGVGLAFIPRGTWPGLEDDPNIALVNIESPRCSRWVTLSWSGGRRPSPAALLLRDYLVEFFSSLQARQPSAVGD